MSTITCIDYRRTDQRTSVLENPFWLTSGLVSAVASDDLGALLFSFPKAKQLILIHDVVVQNVAALTAATTVDIGTGTLALDTVTTGGDITIIAKDSLITNVDSVVTAATCWGCTTANTSTWLTLKASGAYTTPRFLVGVATATVPCIYASVARSGVISAGTFRVHVLVTIVPGT